MDLHVTGNWTAVHSQSMSVCRVFRRKHSSDFILDVKFEKGLQRSFCLNCHTCWSHGTVYQSWTIRSCHVTTREQINPNRMRRLIILIKKLNLRKFRIILGIKSVIIVQLIFTEHTSSYLRFFWNSVASAVQAVDSSHIHVTFAFSLYIRPAQYFKSKRWHSLCMKKFYVGNGDL